MVEVRKSTWVLLALMCLLIFAPLFFIDVDGLPGGNDDRQDNDIHPSVPNPKPKPVSNEPPDNPPPENRPPENEPENPDPN